MMARALPVLLLLASLLPSLVSSASAGARLDAMAGDGLLITDVDADHLWPASLRDHAQALALRSWSALGGRDVRLHDGSAGVDLRHAGGRYGRLRGFWRPHADAGPSAADAGLQAAWSLSGGSVGLAWTTTELWSTVVGAGRRQTWALGARLVDRLTTVVDLTAGFDRYEERSGRRMSAGSLRLRVHRRLSERITGLVMVEERNGPSWSLGGWRAAGGLLFWPDADLQILVAWREEDHDVAWFRRDGGSSSPDSALWMLGSRGPQVSAELRLSSWLSWRSGVRMLWLRNSTVSSPSTWLGLGGTLHAGPWDAVLGLSRRESSAAPGFFPSDRVDARLRLDVIRYF